MHSVRRDAAAWSVCSLLFLRHDDTPWVARAPIHDVPDPGLYLVGEGAPLARLAHRELDVAAAVVDQRYRANEELTKVRT